MLRIQLQPTKQMCSNLICAGETKGLMPGSLNKVYDLDNTACRNASPDASKTAREHPEYF